jgi:hypothetical protein
MIARENPFRADRVLACRYRPQSVGWDELIDRIQRHRYRAAIIGPEGTGKTTLLEDLAPRLDAMGHRTRLVRWQTFDNVTCRDRLERVRQCSQQGEMILLDGADQMPVWAWMIFRWRVTRFIVTANTPRWATATLIRTQTSLALLDAILAELLETDDRLRWQPVAHELFDRHRGNIREVLRDLYDLQTG